MVATAFLIVGFLTTIVGVALWSVPAACVVAGVWLFVAGGVASRSAAK